ncbi:YraN family protein [Halomicronema sp. CCY15110]|uniref:YraN family protein n=1 Tax=Halomicronema sp. CCY15110 TaxID=2767773 RepID=UPI00194E8EE7|nr:YraN family protein [Halomicronema sp. CCY15110]
MPTTAKRQLGDRGEALVAAWLRQQGWEIVAQQWHCRWGELDLVARHVDSNVGVVFVEVKTRRRPGLDQGGRLAITPQKQQKLWRSAQTFLTEYVAYSDLPCRFDVALVSQGKLATGLHHSPPGEAPLTLVEYIENAFQG